MKGGYQIINLSGTTAGDPVTVPGIYNMAKENHEKAVMLYTPDSQRVFSQIKKVDGVYKTTYLSAEGNVVTVEIASNDAVTTTTTNPTSSIVGLEVAVNDLSETKANRADVASISIDGNYNDTGETIPAGTFLYLNNELIKTTASVLDEGEFIESGEGANYTVDTVGGELTQLNSNKSGKLSFLDTSLGELTIATNTYFKKLENYNVSKSGYKLIAPLSLAPSSGNVKAEPILLTKGNADNTFTCVITTLNRENPSSAITSIWTFYGLYEEI